MSPTEICNIALAHIGDARINSIDGTETNEVICKTYYNQARREVIETVPWTFARKRALLSTLAETPAFKWSFQAALPSDYVRVLIVRAGNAADDPEVVDRVLDSFEVSGGNILTDSDLIGLYYIADIDNPGAYSPSFVTALARLMASYIAISISGDPRMALAQREIYRREDLPRAQYLDQVQDRSNENGEVEFNKRRSPLIAARFKGNTGTTFGSNLSSF